MVYLLILDALLIGFNIGMYVNRRMSKKVFKAADDAIAADNRLIELLKLRIHLYEHKYGDVDEHVLH